MTLEVWNTIATTGTFLFIGATAIAAIVNLRYASNSYQIASLTELQESYETGAFTAARQFIYTNLSRALEDPALRYQILNRSVRTHENQGPIAQMFMIANFYERLGIVVKKRLIDAQIALEMWSASATSAWEALEPFIAITRRETGTGVWENFEYFIVLAQDWSSSHPDGAYPAGTRRIPVKDEWLEEDLRYAGAMLK